MSFAQSSPTDRAGAARVYLRARRAPRFRPTPYQVYLTVLLAAIGGALGGHAISTLVSGNLNSRELAVYGPALLMLVLLGAMRFGTWQGPVAFSAADVLILLMAPIPLTELVRPKLDQGLAIGGLAGAVLAGGVLVLMALAPAGIGVAGSICGVLALASVGVLGVAASWLVQSSRSASERVRRASPAILASAAVLLWATSTSSLGRSVGVWSGPWGWALVPFTGTSRWPLGVILIVALAGAGAVLARRRAGAATVEQFLARAETRAGITASALALDYRSAALTHRAALPAAATRMPRVPRPTRPALAVPWRASLALVRDRYRVVWAVLIGGCATWEVLANPGRVVPAGLAAGALYFAASLLCEPLRIDVDDPDKSALLLARPFAQLLLDHCVLPALALLIVTAVTIVGAVLTGLVGAGALALIPTVLVPIVGTAVLCAALATLRGGRIGETLLSAVMSSDPSNPFGASMIAFWLAPWLIVNLAATGVALAIIGHASAHHRPIIPAVVLALALSSAATAILFARARRSARPS